MYCWKCGDKHLSGHKFCPECGARQVRPEMVEDSAAEPTIGERTRQSPMAMEPRHPETISPVAPEIHQTMPVNPLVEEPRIVHEPIQDLTAPVQETAAIREHIPGTTRERTRISTPSLLGLSDQPDLGEEDSSYLFDEPPVERSTWRAWAVLAVLLLFAFLAYKHWTTVSGAAMNFANKAGKEIAADNARDVAAKSEKNPADEGKLPVSLPADPTNASATSKPKSDALGAGINPDAATGDGAGTPVPVESAEMQKPESDESVSKPPARPVTGEEARAAAPAAPAAFNNSEVELAQKYLQGRGVPQNCERGLSVLQSAARKPNPKASIQMGALYASGHCVNQDRAEAYKWFAKAHREDPNNMWIEKNLNSLWANMRSDERARAER